MIDILLITISGAVISLVISTAILIANFTIAAFERQFCENPVMNPDIAIRNFVIGVPAGFVIFMIFWIMVEITNKILEWC